MSFLERFFPALVTALIFVILGPWFPLEPTPEKKVALVVGGMFLWLSLNRAEDQIRASAAAGLFVLSAWRHETYLRRFIVGSLVRDRGMPYEDVVTLSAPDDPLRIEAAATDDDKDHRD